MKKWGWFLCLGLIAQTYSPMANNLYYQNNQNTYGSNPYYQPSKEEQFQNYLQVIGGLLNNLNSFQQQIQTQRYSNQATSRGYYQRDARSSFQGNSFGR